MRKFMLIKMPVATILILLPPCPPASSTLRGPSMSLDSSRRNLHRSSAQKMSETSVSSQEQHNCATLKAYRPTSWLLRYAFFPHKTAAFVEKHASQRPGCAVFRCPAPQHLQLRGGQAQCLEAADPQRGEAVAKSERMTKLCFLDMSAACP